MKHTLTIQVDLDSYASLLRFYDNRIDENDIRNSALFYMIAVPRFLDLFSRHGIKATFFVSGWDITNNREAMDIIRLIHKQGHEIANHSYHHFYNLMDMDITRIREEIKKNALFIKGLTGSMPVGFKSPGCSVKKGLFSILAEEGYTYDSSVAPSLFYYFCKKIRNAFIHNGCRSGHTDFISIFSPTQPYPISKSYIWRMNLKKEVVEIPMDCFSVFKFPFYSNTLLWLRDGLLSRWAYRLVNNRHMCFFMHGIDLVDFVKDRVDLRLKSHPNLIMSLNKKLEIIEHFFELAKANFVFKRSDRFAQEVLENEDS